MKRVYSSPNNMMAHHVKNLLEIEGIRCEVRRDLLVGALSGIMPSEAWVEVWVEPNDFERAWEFVQSMLHEEATEGRGWKCPGCGEQLEAQFTSCWSCGTVEP